MYDSTSCPALDKAPFTSTFSSYLDVDPNQDKQFDGLDRSALRGQFNGLYNQPWAFVFMPKMGKVAQSMETESMQ